MDNYKDIVNIIEKNGIIPVIEISNLNEVEKTINSLIEGGIDCVEITFRTEHAEKAIKLISSKFPNILIGAGTVLTIEQVNKAVNAGANFIITPGFNDDIVEYCLNLGILIIPGCATATEIDRASKKNINLVKFFPATLSGGAEMISALSGPYPNMKYIATGGISQSNLSDFLSCNNVIACGGTWILAVNLTSENRYDEITKLTKNAVDEISKLRAL